MAGKYYFTFLKKSVMTFVKSNQKVSKERLLEFGAMQLANKVALEEQLRAEEKEQICKTASTTFAFDVRDCAHKLFSDKKGMTYYLTIGGMAFTEHILYKQLEDFLKLDEEDKQKEIAKTHAEHKYHETVWRSKVGQHTLLPKKVEKKPERETILFNMLIDGLMEKIPAKTTTADSITHNLWWSFASEVATVLVDGDKSLGNLEFDDRGDRKSINIVENGKILHEFVLKEKGIIYTSIEEEEEDEEEEEKESFKGYKEIVSDYMKKRNV